MSRTARFSQADIMRALKAGVAAGVPVAVFIEPSGRLAIVPAANAPLVEPTNDLDARLDEFGKA